MHEYMNKDDDNNIISLGLRVIDWQVCRRIVIQFFPPGWHISSLVLKCFHEIEFKLNNKNSRRKSGPLDI